MSGVAEYIVHDVVNLAGGRIVGRTKMQKILYFLVASKRIDKFRFYYKNFGPYSDDATYAIDNSVASRLLSEESKESSWGSTYYVYTSHGPSCLDTLGGVRDFVVEAAKSDPVRLELAATALFLFESDFKDPWDETARRKPEKCVGDSLSEAKALYRVLRERLGREALPEIS